MAARDWTWAQARQSDFPSLWGLQVVLVSKGAQKFLGAVTLRRLELPGEIDFLNSSFIRGAVVFFQNKNFLAVSGPHEQRLGVPPYYRGVQLALTVEAFTFKCVKPLISGILVEPEMLVVELVNHDDLGRKLGFFLDDCSVADHGDNFNGKEAAQGWKEERLAYICLSLKKEGGLLFEGIEAVVHKGF
jgi:hypothetical protein